MIVCFYFIHKKKLKDRDQKNHIEFHNHLCRQNMQEFPKLINLLCLLYPTDIYVFFYFSPYALLLS